MKKEGIRGNRYIIIYRQKNREWQWCKECGIGAEYEWNSDISDVSFLMVAFGDIVTSLMETPSRLWISFRSIIECDSSLFAQLRIGNWGSC